MTATRKLALSDMPGWPRMMSQSFAAAYTGLSATTFNRAVMRGDYPQPIWTGGRKTWDKAALDRAISALTKTSGSAAIDGDFDAYEAKIRSPRQRSARKA